MYTSTLMYTLPEHIGYTNPYPPVVPDIDYYLTDSYVSVSGREVRLKNDVESQKIHHHH